MCHLFRGAGAEYMIAVEVLQAAMQFPHLSEPKWHTECPHIGQQRERNSSIGGQIRAVNGQTFVTL